MPKSTHSRTRVPHKGPRHEADPDRRVKYVLRYRRKGDEVEPQTTLVRRHRRSQERTVSPTEHRLSRLTRIRRDRHATRERLEQIADEYNSSGEVRIAEPLT